MKTPIYDFVTSYVKKNTVRAHMPGHKGILQSNAVSAAYPYDITEIAGADALYEASGIIAESEKNASGLFGTEETFYSAEGSSLCIRAMLSAVCGKGSKAAAARNSHRAFLSACILLEIDPVWIYPEFSDGSVISGEITAASVRKVLESEKDISCVFITSPDYLGKIADISGISAVCREYGVPLLVDNAHGAHLAFLDEPCHPIKLGADMCCDSAHKTLPVLTGGAYLHSASHIYTERAREAMSLFGSSSPSYLILQSLDLCNKYLAEDFREDLRKTVSKLNKLKNKLKALYRICPSEPLKLTVYTLPSGKTGFDTANYLRSRGIEPEYADMTHVMLMFSPFNTDRDLQCVYEAFASMPMPRIFIAPPEFKVIPPEKAMTPSEAYFAPSETIPAEEAAGRICSRARTVCPPCIPIIAGGEIFSENSVKILKMYSISEVNVVK